MEEQFQDLFRIRHNNDRVEAGKVLIAEPFLQGSYFSRSVVYLVEHNEKGSVGFILNKSLGCTASELVHELEGVDFPVYLGGPVEPNQLYYIHTRPDIEQSLLLADGVYWGGNFKQLVYMLKNGNIGTDQLRFFAGYSGWDKGQLYGELEEHSWMVGGIERSQLFASHNEYLWEQAMRKLGGRHKIWANFPKDPILN